MLGFGNFLVFGFVGWCSAVWCLVVAILVLGFGFGFLGWLVGFACAVWWF